MKKLLPIFAAFAIFAAILAPIAQAGLKHSLKADTAAYPKLIVLGLKHAVEADKEIYLVAGYDNGVDSVFVNSDTLMVESEGYFWPLALAVYEIRKGGLEIFDRKPPKYDEVAKGHPANAEKAYEFVMKPTSKWRKMGDATGTVILHIRDPRTGKTADVPVLLVRP